VSDLIPPFPPRLPKRPTPWKRVRLGRRNLLAAFEEEAFNYHYVSMTVLAREVFLCKELVEGFSDYQRRVGQFDFVSLLGLPDWVRRPHPPGVYCSVRRIRQVLDELIAEHRAQRDRNDAMIVDRLLDARDEETGEPLDARALRNEAAVLLMAGHETTANTLAWTWYILSQVPEVEAKLHAEVDRALGGRPPPLADVPSLVYTRAVVEEVLRLYPPAPLLTREALHDEKYHTCHIPKGSLIVVSPWLLHRHRTFWRQPDHFIPERFLPGGDRPASKFAYIPFSIGPRICTGMAFGLTEAILSIAIAQRFMLRLVPGHRVEVACRLTLRPGDRLPMQLIQRPPVQQTDANVGVRDVDRRLAADARPSCPFAAAAETY
jgi:cytochrome P450